MVTATLNAWASEMGIDQQTLERRLVRSGYTRPASGWGQVSFKKIYVAIMGDEQAEKIRNLKADADRKEREEQVAKGELFPMAELEPWLVQNYVQPMAAIMGSAPSTLDTRCNPEHPEIARRALSEWFEGMVKPALKTNLQKPKL